jgi:hypothetical protein
MLKHSIEYKKLAFKYVLMDTWYATKDIMLYIDGLQKIFYCPLKSNRKVDDSKGINPYKAVSDLTWTDTEQQNGKRIKIHGFPKDYKVQLFRVTVNDNRTDWIVTNDTRLVCAIRWKIEQFHREIKQLTGIEDNQCRKARIQRNHVCCSMLVWVQLARHAKRLKQTLYQVKKGLLSDYLREQLRSPSVKFA